MQARCDAEMAASGANFHETLGGKHASRPSAVGGHKRAAASSVTTFGAHRSQSPGVTDYGDVFASAAKKPARFSPQHTLPLGHKQHDEALMDSILPLFCGFNSDLDQFTTAHSPVLLDESTCCPPPDAELGNSSPALPRTAAVCASDIRNISSQLSSLHSSERTTSRDSASVRTGGFVAAEIDLAARHDSRAHREASTLAASEYESDYAEDEYDDQHDLHKSPTELVKALALSGDYGAGYAEQSAAANGVDLRALTRRIMLLLSSSSPESFLQATRNAAYGIPVNLLRRSAPHLRSHLSAMLSATTRARPSEVALRMCSEFAFDGVHLTLCGFAAALVADRHNQLTASVPRGYMLTAPRHLVASSTDIHSRMRATTSLRDTDFDEDDGVWSSSVSLSTLFSRFPHLVRLFRSAKRAAITGAEELLAADAAGKTQEIPMALSRLYASFIQGLNSSAACWVLRPEGVSQVVSHSPPFLRLLGINDASLRQYMSEDPDSSEGNPMLWLHPSNTARRAMASLTAANQGLDTYTFEGLHMRRVGSPGDHSGSFLPSHCTYSPFYALQTVHIERFPNGAKRLDIVYFSDIVNVRKTVDVSELKTALTEVEALEQIVGQPELPREVTFAMGTAPQAPDALVSMLSQLDQDSRLRFVKRLCMVLQHETDPLLQQHIHSEQTASSSSSSESSGSAAGAPTVAEATGVVPMLNGVTHHRLDALKQRLLRQLGPRTLEVVQAMLMRLVAQQPRQVLFVWDGREHETAFPYAAIRKAAQRWSAPIVVPQSQFGSGASAASAVGAPGLRP